MGVALCERIEGVLEAADTDYVGELGDLAERADSVPAVQKALRDYRSALVARGHGQGTEDELRTAMGRLFTACTATGWTG